MTQPPSAPLPAAAARRGGAEKSSGVVPEIVAIVFSAQVNGLWAQGRYADAQKMSSRAKTWVIIAAVLGLIVIAINLIAYASGAYNTPETNAAMLSSTW